MSQESQSRTARRKQNKKKNSKKQKNKKQLVKRIFLIAFIALILIGIGIIGLFASYVKDAPSIDASKLTNPISAKVFDMNGELIADLGTEKRTKVEYNDLPDLLIDAVIATEDARFFEHYGIDFKRIVAAVYANVTDGFGAEGASTITQQVIKLLFLSPEKSVERKVQEQWLALKLEQKYSKKQIFEMYLNKIYYANSVYGVAKASEFYFGKSDLNELTLPEAALLAGIPQRPNAYDPIDHPDLAKNRRNLVLDLMVHHGKISQAEADEAKEVTIESMIVENDKLSNTPYSAFIEQALQEVNEKVENINVYTDGVEIYTTLDQNAQNHVEYLLGEESPIPFPEDEFQAGIVVTDTKTGEIRAIGGGRNIQAIGSSWNYALDGEGRQPGSTIKPIVAYAPAIEKYGWSTYHQILDEPYQYSSGDPINNWYSGHKGMVSMRDALTVSMNIPALKALQEVGVNDAQNFAEKLGVNFHPKFGLVESDAIGGGTQLTPLTMAGAFSAFGNEGIYFPPHAVSYVKFQNGKTIDFKPEPTVAMSEHTAYMITDMLKSVMTAPNGTGRSANVSGLPVAGKTGTTNRPDGGTPDSWMNGYTTNYTISVWTGYPEMKQTIAGKDQAIAKQLFKDIMGTISKDKETKDFVKPSSIIEVAVEEGTWPAKLPSEYTPEDLIIHELFLRGKQPTEKSDAYQQLDPVIDLQAFYIENEQLIELEWELPNHEGQSDSQEPTNEQEVSFEISVSVNDGPMELITTTKEKTLVLSNVEPGVTYTFQIVTVSDVNPDNISQPAVISLEVPETEEDSIEDLLDELTGNENDEGHSNPQDGESADTENQQEQPSEEESQQTSEEANLIEDLPLP